MKHRSTPISPSPRREPVPRLSLLTALLPLGALLAACADPAPRELGFTQAVKGLEQVPTEAFFSEASEFVGTWVGSAEEPLALTSSDETPIYRFPSGSSRISVLIEQGEDGLLTGHISFGSGEPPPPPSDPDVGYPAGVAYEALTGYEAGTFGDANEFTNYLPTTLTLPPFEGFAYRFDLSGATSIEEGNVVHLGDGVASLEFSTNEPLGAWCELQRSYPFLLSSGFSCLPDYGGGFETAGDGTGKMCSLFGPADTSECLPDLSNLSTCYEQGEPVAKINCDKVSMCTSGFCSCDETGCRAAPGGQRLTLRRVGTELVGLFENLPFENARGLNTPIGEVHLQLE
jgi:hypothetical protein